jgi:uncharacterized protein (DUF4415 family)
MKHKVTYLENDGELNDDIEPEYDLEKMGIDRERTRKYRELALRNLVRLDPDVAEFFKTPEEVNEALRQVMRERRDRRSQVD